MKLFHGAAAALLILGLWQAVPARSAEILPAEKASEVLALRNIEVKDGGVSGEVANRSKHAVRDVELSVRHTWLWKDEFHPGKDDPSTAAQHRLGQEIPPGGAARFTYRPASPLPQRADGRFETTVSIAGFAEIIPVK